MKKKVYMVTAQTAKGQYEASFDLIGIFENELTAQIVKANCGYEEWRVSVNEVELGHVYKVSDLDHNYKDSINIGCYWE